MFIKVSKFTYASKPEYCLININMIEKIDLLENGANIKLESGESLLVNDKLDDILEIMNKSA